MTTLDKDTASARDLLAATIYLEARDQPEEGQRAVADVIQNRAEKDREYWGGSEIEDVCTKPDQFECWRQPDNFVNGDMQNVRLDEPKAWETAQRIADESLNGRDTTGGCDHYNNPDKEGYPDWTKNVEIMQKIGDHQFYKGN